MISELEAARHVDRADLASVSPRAEQVRAEAAAVASIVAGVRLSDASLRK
ncbi:MAG TPA: hypothetical protein VHN14_06455 [Kofleriaceae bacterium]|jgi:hypothetical protein|nr:hypothetical protein [Kofleriaceae bacterium]